MRSSRIYMKTHSLPFQRSAILIETVVALSLLLTILVGTASMIISVQQTNIHANELNIANNAASEQIEIMKSLTLAELIAAKADPNVTAFEAQRVIDGQIRELKPLPGDTVPGKISIEAVAGGKLIRVHVTVDWQSPLGPRSYSLVWMREVVNASGR